MTNGRELVAAALPNYEVGGELGRGGWGVVLEGRHRQLDRPVAIKQLPPAIASSPGVRGRFLAEGRVLASLDHPHIVPIYDYVEQDGLCLLVMERLPGGTVWGRFVSSGLSMPSACAITVATCAGLQCAHDRGVLHRDVKPENLLFSAAGNLKVTDFGIAKVVGGGETMATRAGEVLGTPAYMAPEQVTGGELTPATDVYATGTMLYELLAGVLPFSEEGEALAVLYRHVHETPRPLTDAAPGVPVQVAEVVMRALSTAPGDRQATAEELGAALIDAATAAWGPAWLDQAGVPVMATGRIAEAVSSRLSSPAPAASAPTIAPSPSPSSSASSSSPSETLPPPPPATAAPPTLAPSTVAPAPVPASSPPPTLGDPASASTAVFPVPGMPAGTPVVRPQVHVHVHMGKAGLGDVDENDLVPLREVANQRSALIPALAAAACFLVVVAVTLVGLSSPARTGELAMTVNGVDPASVSAVHLDLSKPIQVQGSVPAGATDITKARLRLSTLGVTLGSATATVPPTSDKYSITIDATSSRYLAPSRVTGTFSMLAGSASRGDESFPVRTAQSPFLTAPGIGAIALLLFVVASVESQLRAARRGRSQVTTGIGLAVLGALFGLVVMIVVWLLAGKQPTEPTAVVCAALGLAAGVSASIAAARRGKARARARANAKRAGAARRGP